MPRPTQFLATAALALTLLAITDSPNASAQGFSIQVGGFGISNGHHGHQHFGPSIRPIQRVQSYRVQPVRRYSAYPNFGRTPYFHNTTHLDYHGPKLVPHNGHLDYVPGHYHVHQTGHWHP